MENQEIDKQLKSQNLKGKIALILGIINLSLVLMVLLVLFSYPIPLTISGGVLRRIFTSLLYAILYAILYGATFLVALIGIIFGFLGWKSIKGKIGIILCIISLFASVFAWLLYVAFGCCY